MKNVALSEYAELLNEGIPPEVLAIPSMMSPSERQFLYGLAKSAYTGKGRLVDAGLFLGASTACFGAGLRDNKNLAEIRARFERPIISYEQAIVRDNLHRTLRKHGIELKTGDSFAPEVEKNIAPVRDLVELNIADILTTSWGEEPIEILYLDVLKTNDIISFAYSTYFPKLLPGAIVLQQDYFFDGLPNLKIKQESLSEYFDYLGEIHSMGVFRLKTPIPAEELARDARTDFSIDERDAMLDQARDRTFDTDRKFLVELSHVRMLAMSGEMARARALWDSLTDTYFEQLNSKTRRMQKAFGKIERALEGKADD